MARMDGFTTGPAHSGLNRALGGYYLATVGFLALDVGLGINVRLSFLESYPGWRIMYYLLCFACLAVIVAKPALTVAITALESLVTMVLLILSTATRVMLPESTGGALEIETLVNFLISGFAAYLSWTRSMTALFGRP